MHTILHPAYFPNIATMAVLSTRSCIWEVHDYYQKQTYRNRSHICTDQGRQIMSIPIKHVGGKQGKQYYRDVRIDNHYPWQRQHWRTLQTAYRSSPFFEYYEDDLSPLYHSKYYFLLDFNFSCIEVVAELLEVPLPTMKTDIYEPAPEGLMDMRVLINAKKNLPFDQEPYTQVFVEKHGFIENVSILDLLFNKGTLALDYLRSQHLNFLHA